MPVVVLRVQQDVVGDRAAERGDAPAARDRQAYGTVSHRRRERVSTSRNS